MLSYHSKSVGIHKNKYWERGQAVCIKQSSDKQGKCLLKCKVAKEISKTNVYIISVITSS